MANLQYKTLRENIVDAIRTKILNQELEPGMHIVEQSLSDEFGVSRGPIREALRQLEQEGLVEYSRNVGCSVKKVSIEDVYEIYLMKSTYEILAVRQYKGDFSGKELDAMEKILKKMKNLESGDIRELILLDHELHQIIMEKSGLSRVTRAWKELEYGSNIAGAKGGSYQKTMAKHQYKIHKVLVDACKSGDEKTICNTIFEHYMLPVRKVMEEKGIVVNKYKWCL